MKFRAYDPTTNKMYYSPNEHIFLNIDGTCSNFQNGELLQPMLWSGLTIVNGNVDIYDSDIVKITLGTGQHVIATVVFIDGCFDVVGDGVRLGRDYLKCSTINRAVEVVGNTKQHKIESFQ